MTNQNHENVLRWLSAQALSNPEYGRHINRQRGYDSPTDAADRGTICVVGGGTAGYLSALACQRSLPGMRVVVVESPNIAPLSVGESTVNRIIPFLHRRLGIDIEEFYKAVQPTWKLGIHFDWGPPEAPVFEAPFDWAVNTVGVLGAFEYEGSVNHMSLGSRLMAHNRTPIISTTPGEEPLSLLPFTPFAYHFDTARLNTFLRSEIEKAGIERRELTIVDVDVVGETVRELRGADGERVTADLFVDCSGFRSLLLEKALGEPYISFESSLRTDRALAFERSSDEVGTAYTSATTMEAGWCWTIPLRDAHHHGYVFCSDALDDEDALAEVHDRYGDIDNARFIPFRSGRHERPWVGNVVAIGNAYAFVEPLQSTAIAMVCEQIGLMVEMLSSDGPVETSRVIYNQSIAERWDGLRWFLALHYRFNQRLDSVFWKDARVDTDISGAEVLVDAYQTRSPLRFWGPEAVKSFGSVAPTIYGLAGVDCMLAGMGLETERFSSPEPEATWRARLQKVEVLARSGLSVDDALAYVEANPSLLHQVLHDDRSWVNYSHA